MSVHRLPNPESVFTYGAPQLKSGAGAAPEDDLAGIFRRSLHLW